MVLCSKVMNMNEKTISVFAERYDSGKICDRIDCALKAKKMSRRELARKIGVAPSTLQSIMERKGDFSAFTLFKIGEVLGIDPARCMIGRDFRFDDDDKREIEYALIAAWRAASEDDKLIIYATLKKYGFVYPPETAD